MLDADDKEHRDNVLREQKERVIAAGAKRYDHESMLQGVLKERLPELYSAMNGHYTARVDGALVKSASSIADGAMVTLPWKDPRTGASGRHEFVFYSGPTLAADLFVVSTGKIEDYKMMNGGWLYLLGEPELAWSMLMHWRECGTVAPGAEARGMPVMKSTVWGRELERLTELYSRASTRVRGQAVSLPGRSIAATAALTRTLAPSLPFLNMEDPLPAKSEALPAWWVNAARPWNEALARISAGQAPSCMFYLAEVGRAGQHTNADGLCAGCHDEEWQKSVAEIKARGSVAS